ncbi:pentatricopeptide repeat-containing protein [Tanacetum coccineum]
MQSTRTTVQLAKQISKALITASSQSNPPRTWTPLLEQTLHSLHVRSSLNSQLVSQVIDPFLITHHSLALGFFNWAQQQPAFTHTSLSYHSIFKSLTLSRQYNALDKLMKEVKANRIVLNGNVYRQVIASYLVGRRVLNAFWVFHDVGELVCDVGHDVCNSLLASLCAFGHVGYGYQVFDEMMVRSVRVSTLGFGVFLWRWCGSVELDKVLTLVDEVKRRDCGVNGSVVALLVVHGLCSASRVDDAMCMLDALRKRGWKPDFMAYRVVAEALRGIGNVVDVERVLKMKRKLGVAPRSSDYKDFINRLISERLINEARDLGEVIVNGEFPIDDDILNALIGSVSTNDPFSAIKFFKFLVAKESFPTLLTISNLSGNLCKNGNHDELIEVFKILSDKMYFVDMEKYNVMVSFLCKAGKVKEAYEVLQEMKKKGLGPDLSCYNNVMEACCREDMIRPAKRLWDEMFANGCEANLKTYNILITKFSEIGQVKEAYTLFCHMLQRGVEPDETTYVFLLKGLCQNNELETALEVFKKCFERDAEIAQTILGKFIRYLCKEGQFVAASNLVLDYASTIRNLESSMILLKLLVDAGEVPVAIEHVKKVGEMSPQMLHELHAEFLSSLSSSSKLRPMLELIQVIEALQRNLQSVSNRRIPNYNVPASRLESLCEMGDTLYMLNHGAAYTQSEKSESFCWQLFNLAGTTNTSIEQSENVHTRGFRL